MKIIDEKELKNEGELSKKEKRISYIKEFQASAPYETIMEIIQEALDYSLVKELLAKQQGAANESEVGRLTITEWMSNEKINTRIKSVLTRKYD